MAKQRVRSVAGTGLWRTQTMDVMAQRGRRIRLVCYATARPRTALPMILFGRRNFITLLLDVTRTKHLTVAYPITPVLEALGLTTPAEFGRGSRQVTINEDDAQIEVRATRNTGSDFDERPDAEFRLPPRADDAALGDAILQAMEQSE